ncbi:MAG: transcription elongation factor GreA [Eubacterium sp.]|nr:transcription elongation factor GreA [Eubacterium sp.]
MAEEVLMTREGYEKLEAERDELVTVRRKEVSEKLKEARSYGDLSENAEYDAAKEEQAEVEERIMKLDQMIRNAKIINEEEVSDESVNVGLTVTVRDLDDKSTIEYTLVGSTESDPFAEPAKISNESEIGKNLIGKKIGDKVEILVPAGMIHYEIVGIRR